MSIKIKRTAFLRAVGMLILTSMSVSSWAADQQSGKWEAEGQVFLWGAGVDGLSATDTEFNIPLEDVLGSLDFAAMGSVAARREEWTLFGDVIYLNLGANASIPLQGPNQTVQAQLNLDLRTVTSTFGAAYRVAGSDSSNLSLMAGGRYLSMDVEIDYDFEPGPAGSISGSGNTLDFVVGALGRVDLNDSWYLNYYGDMGWGDSDRTWRLVAGANYRMKKVDLTFGYSVLNWDFDNDSLMREMKLSGPYMAVKFPF